MNRAEQVSRRLIGIIAGLLVVAAILFGALIIEDFNRALEPELERRSGLIGTTVHDDVERALNVGIPLERLVGVEAYVETLMTDFAELEFVVVRDGAGTVLHSGGDVSEAVRAQDFKVPLEGSAEDAGSLVSRYPLATELGTVGAIDVGVDGGFVRVRLEDLALDLMVIVVVALVLAYELALAVSERVAGRGRRRSSGVAEARLVLFVFVVGEELSKSFLPQFILGATDPGAALDPAVAVSLPIVAYLLTLGLASPFAGKLAGRYGERTLLMAGLVFAAASQVGMVVAADLLQITVLRGLTGVGYAISTIACLEYLIERQPRADRIRATGAFIAVVIGGTFAGTALGGILADRLGYRPVFALSAVLVLAAGLLAWRLMSAARTGSQAEEPQAFSIRDVAGVLHQPRLLALMAGVTVPMNVLLAAFLWYLVPLTLAASGESAAVIGRTLMLYYLAVLLAAPAVGRLTAAGLDARLLVGIGSVISGAVLLIPAGQLTTLAVSVAVVIVGLGHAAIRGPQLVLAIEIGEAERAGLGRGATLAVMRTLERLGALVGLLVAAVVAARWDLLVAMAAIGVATGVAGVAYLSTVLVGERGTARV